MKQRAFTLTVGATLAVCLGVNAALFAVVDHVLLRPLPIPAPERVVITGSRYPKAGVDSGYSTSAADYIDRLRETNVFEEQALFKLVNRSVDENGAPARVPVMGVTPSFFHLAHGSRNSPSKCSRSRSEPTSIRRNSRAPYVR